MTKSLSSKADFEIQKHGLLGALDVACMVAQQRTASGALDHILIDADPDMGKIEVTATDLIRSVWLERPAAVHRGVVAAIHGRLLRDFVNTLLDGAVSFKIEGKGVCEVWQGKRRYTLPVLPADNYPSTDKPDCQMVPIPVDTLKGLIEATEGAMASPAENAQLAGLHFDSQSSVLRVISLDGRRLHYAERSLTMGVPSSDWKVTIPSDAIEVIKGLFDLGVGEEKCLQFGADASRVVVGGLSVLFASQMIVGKYADWQQVYNPPAPWKARIDRADFLRAMKTAKSVQSEAIGLYPGKEALAIKAAHDKKGAFEDEIPWVLEGEATPLGVSPAFMVDALEAYSTEAVIVSSGSDYPIVIRPVITEKDDGRAANDRAVVMPMFVPGDQP